jgi:hypothetical protein
VVATDAAAAADLTAVRLAVPEGRAVSWGTKARLGEALLRGKAGELGVISVTSRSLAGPLRDAVHIADACAAVLAGKPTKGAPPQMLRQKPRETPPSSALAAEGGNSQATDACAPAQDSGKLGALKEKAAPRGGDVRRSRGWHRAQGSAPRAAERATEQKDRGRDGQRNAQGLEQRAVKPSGAPALSQRARRAARPVVEGATSGPKPPGPGGPRRGRPSGG